MSEAVGLRGKLAGDKVVRLIGAHDGMTAILAEQYGFEAIWAGGLGISTAAGVPDAGIVTMTEMLDAAVVMRRCVNIPIIADVDAGFGDVNVVQRMVRLYEDAHIAGVCIEDKQYPKRNSFREGHVLETPELFARKISVAKDAQRGSQFMVIARLESLIAGAGLDDAVARALLYCDAGADALLIHSRARTVDEVAAFASAARESGITVPLFMIPTTYYSVTADELGMLGANAVVYANQVIRAALRSISTVLAAVAARDGSHDVESDIASVSDLFDLVHTDRLLNDEPWVGLSDGSELERLA